MDTLKPGLWWSISWVDQSVCGEARAERLILTWRSFPARLCKKTLQMCQIVRASPVHRPLQVLLQIFSSGLWCFWRSHSWVVVTLCDEGPLHLQLSGRGLKVLCQHWLVFGAKAPGPAGGKAWCSHHHASLWVWCSLVFCIIFSLPDEDCRQYVTCLGNRLVSFSWLTMFNSKISLTLWPRKFEENLLEQRPFVYGQSEAL